MPRRLSRKTLLFAIVILVATVFVCIEVFYLSPAVRRGAIALDESFGLDDQLAARLTDVDVDVRGDASDALVRRGDKAVPALIRRLDDPDPIGRAYAAAALGRIGPPARAAVPALKRLMRDESITQVVREQMARALGQIASDQPETIDELLGNLETGDESTRILAAEALGGRG